VDASGDGGTPIDAGVASNDDAGYDEPESTGAELVTNEAEAGARLLASGGRALLFGGDGPPLFGDTWVLDSTGWAQQDVAGPPARAGSAAAMLSGKIILFGGCGVALQGVCDVKDDTWVYDGMTWTQQMVTGPSARSHANMAAFAGGKVVLFGGTNASGLVSQSVSVLFGYLGLGRRRMDSAKHLRSEPSGRGRSNYLSRKSRSVWRPVYGYCRLGRPNSFGHLGLGWQ
jgi:hypothetical protein